MKRVIIFSTILALASSCINMSNFSKRKYLHLDKIDAAKEYSATDLTFADRFVTESIDSATVTQYDKDTIRMKTGGVVVCNIVNENSGEIMCLTGNTKVSYVIKKRNVGSYSIHAYDTITTVRGEIIPCNIYKDRKYSVRFRSAYDGSITYKLRKRKIASYSMTEKIKQISQVRKKTKIFYTRHENLRPTKKTPKLINKDGKKEYNAAGGLLGISLLLHVLMYFVGIWIIANPAVVLFFIIFCPMFVLGASIVYFPIKKRGLHSKKG